MPAKQSPAEQAELMKRRQAAMAMRRNGHTWQVIGTTLGYGEPHAAQKAWTDVNNELKKQRAQHEEKVEDHRQHALDRLNDLSVKARTVLDRLHVTVHNGQIVLSSDGEPLRDDGPELAAIKTLLSIEDRRSKLLGLDAPVKVESNVSVVRYEIVGVDPADLE